MSKVSQEMFLRMQKSPTQTQSPQPRSQFPTIHSIQNPQAGYFEAKVSPSVSPVHPKHSYHRVQHKLQLPCQHGTASSSVLSPGKHLVGCLLSHNINPNSSFFTLAESVSHHISVGKGEAAEGFTAAGKKVSIFTESRRPEEVKWHWQSAGRERGFLQPNFYFQACCFVLY